LIQSAGGAWAAGRGGNSETGCGGHLARLGLTAAAALALAGCLATAPVRDPYEQYSPEDRQRIQEDKLLRAQQRQDALREHAWNDTISPEMLRQRLSSGDTGPVEGMLSRGPDVFEGRMVAT